MLDTLSELTGIDIPQEEYIETPALSIPTTAQIVDAAINANENSALPQDTE